MPRNRINTFLNNSHVVGRLFSEYSTNNSIMGGNMSAKAEAQNAPRREMSRTICGITSATATGMNGKWNKLNKCPFLILL